MYLTEEQKAKCRELEDRLNKGVDRNGTSYYVEQCWDGKTEIKSAHPYVDDYYTIDTDDVDKVVEIFKTRQEKKYYTKSYTYDYD